MKPQIKLDTGLLKKYSVNIPRYTSYPTAPEWTNNFSKEDLLNANEIANEKQSGVSLYFHLPFCESRCHFCACNVVISKKKSITESYLEHIKKEIRNLSQLVHNSRLVEQIHLGGGTPTYFNPFELNALFTTVRESFNISKNCEISVEADPRVTTYEHLECLSKLGFNRLSMGIQDFDFKVQESINRIQPFELTSNIFNWSRNLGFNSINVDLVYGLPYQSKEGFAKTMDLILKLNPDRIALFHYAHLPELIPHQEKYILNETLPSSQVKIDIFKYAVEALTANEFIFIGLDHFAKPNDELAIARKNKTLHRNFQGYTTKIGCDLYGFGITAISNIQNTYSQNVKKLNPYYTALDKGKIPLFRGVILNKDDLLRKEIIMKILCHGVVDKSEIEKKYNIDFDKYFSNELEKLKELEDDELLSNIEVTEQGQFFLRNIASAFDYYLQNKNGRQKIYSKSI
ncbi:MAG: oxygen-independent coproporphyrinogen III oxidase [Candidatus Melainabacteria bacterium]|nr:oxygen-independent coproporphyrinogen III oxidase [Candidatus Melainabacteria bacterium]